MLDTSVILCQYPRFLESVILTHSMGIPLRTARPCMYTVYAIRSMQLVNTFPVKVRLQCMYENKNRGIKHQIRRI